MPAVAQIAAIGRSSVRAQTFENEDLFFYVPETGDLFGWSLAAGDFNGDGVQDLATGTPFDDGPAGSGLTDSGIVIVRYGVAGPTKSEIDSDIASSSATSMATVMTIWRSARRSRISEREAQVRPPAGSR